MKPRVLAAAVSIAWVLAAVAALAQAQPDAVGAIEPVMKQLEALRRDDYDTAYTFASASIQEMFDRPAFERMVKGGYPEIARSSSAHVVESRVGPDGHVYLRVKIRGANGNNIEAMYDLVWEGGRFRINGVVAKPDPGLV
jgi:ABC-type transporter MlaC component